MILHKILLIVLICLAPELLRSAGYVKKTVCTSGCDYTVAQLQQAVNDAATYQQTVACVPYIIELEAGKTFSTGMTAPLFLPKKDPAVCREYVRLRSSRLHEIPATRRVTPADAAKLFRIANGNSQAAIATISNTSGTVPTGYWALEGLDLTKPANDNPYTLLVVGDLVNYTPPNVENTPEKTPRNIVVDRCWIHGYSETDSKPQRGMTVMGRHIYIRNSYINAIQAIASESHGIWANNFEDLRIENTLIDAAQLNFLSGGDDMRIPGWTNRHLLLAGNYFTKHPSYWFQWGSVQPPNWACIDGQFYESWPGPKQYECKSGAWVEIAAKPPVFGAKAGVDLKNLYGVHGIGNHFEQIFGFEWVTNQTGSAWLFNQTDPGSKTAGAFNVLIEYNYHKHTGDTFAWGQAGNANPPWNVWLKPHTNFTIRHNLIVEQNRPELVQSGTGGLLANRAFLKLVGMASDVKVYHNTFTFHPSYTGVVAAFDYANFNWSANYQWNGGQPQPDPWRIRGQHFRDNVASYGGGSDPIRGGLMSSYGGNTNGVCVLRNMGYYNPPELLFRGAWTDIGGRTLQTLNSSEDQACEAENRNTWETGTVWDATLGATFVDPAAGNFRIKPGSAAKGSATDGGDMGADVQAVETATADAKLGNRRNPWFDMLIRHIAPAPNGAVIDLVKPTVAECSIVVAANRAWIPAGTVAQTTNGRRVLATVTGLNPATEYFVKAECGSEAYRREASFMTAGE